MFFAQVATPPAQEIVQPQEIRALPGELDQTPVFNSNSPELILEEGILLSTFPPFGENPAVHLNFPFSGRFDIFAHHVAKAPAPEDLRTLYLGILLHNPTQATVTVDVLEAATHLSQPDAPFIELPAQVPTPQVDIYAGPGSRVMGDILWGRQQEMFPAQLKIPPGQSRMLLNVPIPVATLDPPINGRSTYIRLNSTDTIYAASLSMYAPIGEEGQERAPTLPEWQQLLNQGELAGPRDRPPTPLNTTGNLVYGRVAGVSQGGQWQTTLSDPGSVSLAIPTSGQAFSYGLSTLEQGTFGSDQTQSAPMLVRYPDTAYQAHGNYGVQYSLTLPLINPTAETHTVTVSLQTPIKKNEGESLEFFDPPPEQVFFRGPVLIRYTDDRDLPRTRYFHLVQQRGQPGEPLATLTMPPGDRRLVEIEFLYPPDATPPQVLTVRTL
ncbi:MAG: DUF3370 domain-containing protein [Cyanophyceae cyanobacterium]